MRISDWSSDVCSSDLHGRLIAATTIAGGAGLGAGGFRTETQAVCGVEPSQAAAAGADGVYVHHRRADLIAGNEAFRPDERPALARKSRVEGQEVAVRVGLGGRRFIKKKKKKKE